MTSEDAMFDSILPAVPAAPTTGSSVRDALLASGVPLTCERQGCTRPMTVERHVQIGACAAAPWWVCSWRCARLIAAMAERFAARLARG